MSSNIMGDLANATKALNAHRFGVTTAGTNIANVNNPDYARQRAILGDRGTIQTLVGPRGLGVEVVGFAQMRDTVLDREVLRETSINSSLKSQYDAFAKAEANMGQEINRTGDSAFIDGADGSSPGGLAEIVNDYFNAFHSLSANPSSDAEKESLLQKSEMLVQKLNVTSKRFSDLKDDLSSEVQTDLGDTNRLIEEIARLNVEIARAEASKAGAALTLRDQRQSRLAALSEFIQVDVSNIKGSGGQVSVSISTINGSFKLVNEGRPEQISFDDSIPGTPKFAIESSGEQILIKGGSMHGALTARDGGIQDYIGSLDRLASEMVVQVNALYNTGTAPGNTNFFTDTGDPAQRTAAGISLDSTLSTTTLRTTNDVAQEQGDNTLILAIAELDGAEFSGLGDRSFSSFYRATISDLAQNVATVESRLEDEGIVFNLLKEQQDSVSGVSIDEEMTDMMKFQRAFEATARHIKAIDEMLDVIINRLI
jgi:flagellar hook-associated protein 1 FlgK